MFSPPKQQAPQTPVVRSLEDAVSLAYEAGATAVISLSGVDTAKIAGKFGGESASLALPPGDYLVVRMPKPSQTMRGITPHENPKRG